MLAIRLPADIETRLGALAQALLGGALPSHARI